MLSYATRRLVPAELLVLRLRFVLVPQTSVVSLVESVSCFAGPRADTGLNAMQVHLKKEEKRLNAPYCAAALVASVVAAVAAERKEMPALPARLLLPLLSHLGPQLK